jgi:hypothetical protein
MIIPANISELFKYFEYCIFCKDFCREVQINLDPEFMLKIINTHVSDNKIIINASNRKNNIILFKINLFNDSVKIFAAPYDGAKLERIYYSDIMSSNSSDSSDISMSFFSKCNHCNSFVSNSSDMNFSPDFKFIRNLRVVRDTYSYNDQDLKVDVFYSSGNMNIVKESSSLIKTNICNINFADKKSALARIQTIINFS